MDTLKSLMYVINSLITVIQRYALKMTNNYIQLMTSWLSQILLSVKPAILAKLLI